MQSLEYVEFSTSKTPDSSIIWLHGLGADGHDFESLVSELRLPEKLAIRFLFPHAPIQPVSINSGYPMRSWFDILGLSENSEQDEPGIRKAAGTIDELIYRVMQEGVKSERIFLGGFSQGGALALHTALRFPHKLGGTIGLSTYLPLGDFVDAEKSATNTQIPIFLAHGTQDFVVPFRFAQITQELLKKLHYNVTFKEYPIGHTVSQNEIQDLSQWIQDTIT